MNADFRAHLRLGGRWGPRGWARAPAWAPLLRVIGIVAALVALTAATANAQPSPDPYGPQSPSTRPKPDPAPGASGTTAATVPVSPDAASQGTGSTTSPPAPPPASPPPAPVQPTRVNTPRPAVSKPKTRTVPRGSTALRGYPVVVPAPRRAVVVLTSGNNGRSTGLAALALLTLALAGSSLVYLVMRSDRQWREA